MSLHLLTRFGMGGSAFAPDDIAGLRIWLDADDASTITDTGGAVSQWTSKDASSRVFSQATGSLQPTTNSATLNSLNVVSFAGDYLTSTAAASVWNFLHNGTNHHIFAVCKMGVVADPNAAYALVANTTSSAAYGFSLFFDDRASITRNELFQHTISRNQPSGTTDNAVYHVTADGFWTPNLHALLSAEVAFGGTAAERSELQRNSGTVASGNTLTNAAAANDATNALQIGAGGTGNIPLTGEIAEVLVYEGALSAGAVDSVRTYLAAKWGITL